MAIFGVELENNITATKFMEETDKRLSIDNLVTNPFEGKVKRLELEDKDNYVIVMDPVYPHFYQWGLIGILVTFMIVGFKLSYWYLPSLIIYSFGFFWSKYFFFIVLYLGLKKAKYTGKVRLLSNKKILRSIVKTVL